MPAKSIIDFKEMPYEFRGTNLTYWNTSPSSKLAGYQT